MAGSPPAKVVAPALRIRQVDSDQYSPAGLGVVAPDRVNRAPADAAEDEAAGAPRVVRVVLDAFASARGELDFLEAQAVGFGLRQSVRRDVPSPVQDTLHYGVKRRARFHGASPAAPTATVNAPKIAATPDREGPKNHA
jgi:hypothetical protein